MKNRDWAEDLLAVITGYCVVAFGVLLFVILNWLISMGILKFVLNIIAGLMSIVVAWLIGQVVFSYLEYEKDSDE